MLSGTAPSGESEEEGTCSAAAPSGESEEEGTCSVPQCHQVRVRRSGLGWACTMNLNSNRKYM